MNQGDIYDVQTIEVMKRALRRDSSAIDVGCHSGRMLDEILKIAPHGSHLAFEPLPDLFANLGARFGLNPRVQLYDIALSNTSGFTSFQHVTTNDAYSGIRRRRYDRDNETIVEISVRTERLDTIVGTNSDVNFIKIDVEGAELEVFQGAIETIRRCKPVIVFEHGLGAADHYDARPENVFDLLTTNGLRCFLMSDWLSYHGRRALDREAFSSEFNSGRNFYFLAGR